MKFVNVQLLASAKAVGQAETVYSDSFDFQKAIGFSGMLLISTAGSITVTQQVSLDNITWYDAVDKDGNALGAVVSAQTVTTGKYIVFDPVLAPYSRFKIVEGNVGATAVTLKLVYQEEA